MVNIVVLLLFASQQYLRHVTARIRTGRRSFRRSSPCCCRSWWYRATAGRAARGRVRTGPRNEESCRGIARNGVTSLRRGPAIARRQDFGPSLTFPGDADVL